MPGTQLVHGRSRGDWARVREEMRHDRDGLSLASLAEQATELGPGAVGFGYRAPGGADGPRLAHPPRGAAGPGDDPLGGSQI